MTQLPLLELSRLRIAHRYLLKARVEITSYNLHKASPDPGVSRPQTSRLSPGSLKPSSLSNQCSPQRTWAENGFFSNGFTPCSSLLRRPGLPPRRLRQRPQ